MLAHWSDLSLSLDTSLRSASVREEVIHEHKKRTNLDSGQFVRACRCPLLCHLGLQWEQWDVWIARWSWVSVTVLFHASLQDLTKV